jgi:hypothetical protein
VVVDSKWINPLARVFSSPSYHFHPFQHCFYLGHCTFTHIRRDAATDLGLN